jgi:hypothetical protein
LGREKKRMKKVVVLVMTALGISVLLLSGCLPGEKPVEPVKDFAALIDMALSQADTESLLATEALGVGDFREARERFSEVKLYILQANRLFREGENMLPEPERVKYRTILEIYGTLYELEVEFLDWTQARTELEGKEIVDAESASLILPEMETFAESSWRLADSSHKLVVEIDFAVRANPAVREWFDRRVREWNLGLETVEEFIDTLEELVRVIDNVAMAYEDEVQFVITDFDLVYVPLDERVIPTIVAVPPIPPGIIPPNLAAFFNEFDVDRDGAINLGEAEAFFYWVEEHIVYRYDDENDPDGVKELEMGMITLAQLGDGRPTVDYWQTPYETWMERFGDCEDMAILQVAFHNYFGISAYVATVATQPNGVLDHAIAIVLMGGSPEEYRNLLGGLVHYEIDGKHYMLVDNAYSEVFGYLCHGLEEGAFAMKPYINGQYLFTLEEAFNFGGW